MNSKTHPKTTPISILRQNKGQLIVEYILLIFVVVASATLLTKTLVGRGEGSSGIVITKWVQLVQMVGQDIGD